MRHIIVGLFNGVYVLSLLITLVLACYLTKFPKTSSYACYLTNAKEIHTTHAVNIETKEIIGRTLVAEQI